MDLRSETNLDNRLKNVLQHHNAIRKGLNKKVFEKNALKKELLKIAPELLKFAQISLACHYTLTASKIVNGISNRLILFETHLKQNCNLNVPTIWPYAT